MKCRNFRGTMVLLGLLGVACGGRPQLDTRTFRLHSLDETAARVIIEPYVYGDRPDAPGAVAAVQGVLTVRETPDNLDKIARVLAEFDRRRQSVTLSFQIIFANGASSTDPAIAEVVTELRKLFRFEGYRLQSHGAVTGLERSRVHQTMYDETGSPDARFPFYDVMAYMGAVSGEGDSAVVNVVVELSGADRGLFEASVLLGIGHTVVLGTLQLPGNRALILTVKAELAE